MAKMKVLGTLILLGTLITLSFAVPPGFNVQGRLTDSSGINRNGTFVIRFTIFDSYIGGASTWSKDYSVNVKNGNFQVTLEDPDATGRKLLSMVNSAAPSLEFQVISGPGIVGQEQALVPRQRLVSVPFALQAKTAEDGIPVGVIVMWSGSIDAVPAGWALCDGTNSTPDLRERFIVGAGGDNPAVSGAAYTPGLVGGENEHILTLPEMPQHRHNMQFRHTYSAKYTGGYPYMWVADAGSTEVYTDYQGNSAPHENRPPFYALAFIIKK